MAELLTAPARQVDREYFKETHAQIASHSKLLSDAIGESTPSLINFQFGRKRFILGTKKGDGAYRAFSTPDKAAQVSVGYAGSVLEPSATVDAKSKVTPTFGIRVGDSERVVRKAKHIGEHLGGRAVRDAGIILFELARQEGRLSENTLRKAETVLDVASLGYTDDDQKKEVVMLPDAATGKMVQVITEESVPDPENPGAGVDDKIRRARIDKAKHVVASARGVMKGISGQAILIRIAHHHGQEMAYVQSANDTSNNGQWIQLSEVTERAVQRVSVSERLDIIGQRDTIQIGADKIDRKFTFLPPKSSEQIQEDRLVTLIPGWSGPYDGESITNLAQQYANQGNMRALIANARVESWIGEDDLFLRARAIAELIIESGVKKVTLTGHSQGGAQTVDVAYILQQRRKEQLLRGVEPTIPEVEGVVLHDPVGVYDQWGVAPKFLMDMMATPTVAMKDQRKSGKPIWENSDDNSVIKAFGAGYDIAAGMGREMKASKLRFPFRANSEIRGMKHVPLDRKERMAALESPVIIITGAKDPISRAKRFVPGYKVKSASERERHLQDTIFSSSPFVRLLTAERLGRHGAPLFREEDMAREALAQLENGKNPTDQRLTELTSIG